MKIIYKIILSTFILIVLVLSYLYYSSQTLVSNLIEKELKKIGFKNVHLELKRPSYNGLVLKKVSFNKSINNINIISKLSNIKIAYSLSELLNFRLNSIAINHLDIIAINQKNKTILSYEDAPFNLPKLIIAPLNSINITKYNFNALNFLDKEVNFQGSASLYLKNKKYLLKLTANQNAKNKLFDKFISNLNFYETDNQTNLKGEIDIEGFKFKLLPEAPSLQIKNTIEVNSELASLKGSIKSNTEESIKAKTSAQYHISKKNAQLNIDFEELDLSKNLSILSKYIQDKNIQNNLQNLDLNSGDLLSKINIDIENNIIKKIIATIAVKKTSGKFNEINFSNFSLAEHKFSLLPNIHSITPSNIYINEVDYGFTVKNTSCQFQIYKTKKENPIFACNNFSTNIFGGQLLGTTLNYNPKLSSNLFNIKLKDIDLQKILALHPQESLQGSGTFDGYLPIRISNKNNITIYEGVLKSHTKGGILRYKPESNPFLSGNQQLKLIGKALDNFHYNHLNTVLDYNADGNLILNAQIKGKNPDMNKEQEIHVNLKLEENIPALLKSLQLSSEVGTNIEKGLKRK